jgi:hypothetical protein
VQCVTYFILFHDNNRLIRIVSERGSREAYKYHVKKITSELGGWAHFVHVATYLQCQKMLNLATYLLYQSISVISNQLL